MDSPAPAVIAESSLAYLNGEFLPLAEARVPVLDRGFLFGDGVYEVIPVYARLAFRLDDHLRRLQHSLDGIRLANPHTLTQWQQLIGELVKRSGEDNQSLYLHVTRGVAKRDHAFPRDIAATVFMMTNPLSLPSWEMLAHGVAGATLQDNRWLRCDIKAIALLPNVLLRQLAVEAGAAEAVLLRDGHVTEGAASNIFVVRGGKLLAPPKSHLNLPGITYDVVLELANAGGIDYEVRPVSELELRSADEIWLTSASREVLAITTLDGKTVGSGKPGPLFQRMYVLFQDYKSQLLRTAGIAVHA